MTDQLKACPFCGDTVVIHWDDDHPACIIYCGGCDSSSGKYTTEREAIDAWNTRAQAEDGEIAPTVRNDRMVEDARDAERYRFIREGGKGTYEHILIHAGSMLDRLVDLALSAQRGEAEHGK